ncbi:SDR family oxidoreductase [Nocardioides sp. zg-536]|uniref:SDR family oxidoreductase n=1 Tax=Nocardioides faecalis TaxID=2803858 RepID=A0A939BVL3_9ACTN|nr:SDR family oxidoreductase [Nocardioides faecalis]MBM9459672.1 SDR family oxidoreductase [Nocardioides faecalis]MBS4753551.1 SDR family oxidoreductase [Nocardioides faecalis]QVI58192.1 SDR family oxidoreductase [Nocardioides faecalis]
MSRSINGLSIIVTGGARGIGRATVDLFARQGAKVAVGDLDGDLAAEVAAQYDDKVAAAPLDVTDPDSWTAFLAAVDHLGPWDVLVNNAGIMPLGPVLEESHATARSIIDVNVHGVIFGTKAVAPGMVARGRGHIVNVASAVGRVALANGATYSASKFAVVGFSEATRQELAPQGVDVTMVLPSVVNTELAVGVPAARGVKKVTAEDVAEVIDSAVKKPRAELWVPRWGQALSKPTLALPRAVQDAITKAMKADEVLSGTDFSARAAYEARAARQNVAREATGDKS